MIDVLASWYESEIKLAEDVEAFTKAREDHRFTINIPAPWPPNALVERIVDNGGQFNWIEPEPVPEPAPIPEIPIDKQREYRFREETDPLFMSACENFVIGSSDWLTAIEVWKTAKATIRNELPYEE